MRDEKPSVLKPGIKSNVLKICGHRCNQLQPSNCRWPKFITISTRSARVEYKFLIGARSCSTPHIPPFSSTKANISRTHYDASQINQNAVCKVRIKTTDHVRILDIIGEVLTGLPSTTLPIVSRTTITCWALKLTTKTGPCSIILPATIWIIKINRS